MFGHLALHEHRAGRGAETGGEPVHHHVEGGLLDVLRVLVVRRQGVEVGDEEEALVLVLQAHPVLERPVVVGNVHPPRWTHSR